MLAVRTWNLVVFLSTIAIITFVGICGLALWLIWEMGTAKGVLNVIRSKAAMDSKEKTVETEKSWYLWLKKIFSWPKKCSYPSQVTPGSSDDVSATKTQGQDVSDDVSDLKKLTDEYKKKMNLEKLIEEYQNKMKKKSWYLWPWKKALN